MATAALLPASILAQLKWEALSSLLYRSVLMTNNPYFKDVQIDQEAINCLPENGIPNGLRFVLDTEVFPHEDEDEGPPQEHAVDNDVVEESVLGGERTPFIPQPQRQDQHGIPDSE